MGNNLKTSEFNFNTNIWQMVYNYEKNAVIIECRDSELMISSFYGLDLNEEKYLFKDLNFESEHLIVLADSRGQYLLFHVYPDEAQPGSGYLMTFDFTLGEKKIYENFTLKNADGQKARGFIKGDSMPTPAWIDFKTGTLHQSETAITTHNTPITNPLIYPEGSTPFETVAKFLKSKIENRVSGLIEYHEDSSKVVVSYYICIDKKWTNYLLVMSSNQEELLYETIAENRSGPGNDSFFILNNELWYVKNQRTLKRIHF